MKKSLILSLALGLASMSQLMAVDVYITGSTAFRANVYGACTKMFTAAPSIVYGDGNHGGDGTISSGNTSWAMSGTAANTLTNLGGASLTIHALFTGSVSGIQTTEDGTPLIFPKGTGTSGTVVTAAGDYVTNSPTFGFSDSASSASPAYDVQNFGGEFGEERVAVQPFVFCKSMAPGIVQSIDNITWEQARSIIPNGRLPYSSWSANIADTNKFIYLFNRTADSGTRVTTIEEFQYPYDQPIITYLFDNQSAVKGFYLATNNLFATAGTNGYGVIGSSAGNNNANLIWGPGFIGGGDLRGALKYTDVANTSIGYLSFGDSRTESTVNWQQVLPFNGGWLTAEGSAITNGVTLNHTNDFSPVCLGKYPIWTYEVVVYPTGEPIGGGITAFQLGNQNIPGTFLGVLDGQKGKGVTPIVGSLEGEIETSKSTSPGATAIRISDMTASRAQVGGTITATPYPY